MLLPMIQRVNADNLSRAAQQVSKELSSLLKDKAPRFDDVDCLINQ